MRMCSELYFSTNSSLAPAWRKSLGWYWNLSDMYLFSSDEKAKYDLRGQQTLLLAVSSANISEKQATFAQLGGRSPQNEHFQAPSAQKNDLIDNRQAQKFGNTFAEINYLDTNRMAAITLNLCFKILEATAGIPGSSRYPWVTANRIIGSVSSANDNFLEE